MTENKQQRPIPIASFSGVFGVTRRNTANWAGNKTQLRDTILTGEKSAKPRQALEANRRPPPSHVCNPLRRRLRDLPTQPQQKRSRRGPGLRHLLLRHRAKRRQNGNFHRPAADRNLRPFHVPASRLPPLLVRQPQQRETHRLTPSAFPLPRLPHPAVRIRSRLQKPQKSLRIPRKSPVPRINHVQI